MLESNKKDPIKKEIKKEIEKQLKKVGVIRPYRGHKIFRVSKDDLSISDPKWMDPIVSFKNGKDVVQKRIETEEGFFYLSALNKSNCKKKIIKMLGITKEDLYELEKTA